MNNSNLFKQAHKMTKLTIKPNETYRYKFGQWLKFLKTGITNSLGITRVNKSVCYVPILRHDNLCKNEYNKNVIISNGINSGNLLKYVFTNNCFIFIMFIILSLFVLSF